MDQDKRFGFWPLSGRDLLMLMQLLVIVPHAGHLPVWLIAIGVGVVMTQLSLLRRRLGLAHRWVERSIQLLIFFGGVAGAYVSYRSSLGLEFYASFLLLCLIAKLMEVKARRDVYVVLTLALFVTASLFLFSQSLSTGLWAFAAVLGVLYAMIAENDEHTGVGRTRSLLLICAQAVPLLIILFLFFPRLPPLWSIKAAGGAGKTGMSESMSPGDLASLGQSTELAFRAIFAKGQTPPKSQLYWRGLVLSSFDGRTWTQATSPSSSAMNYWAGQDLPQWLQQSITLNSQTPTEYKIIMQPTQREWLFSLSLAIPKTRGTALTRDYVVQSNSAISNRQTIELLRFDAKTIDMNLSAQVLQQSLQLPTGSNPQAREFATALFARMNGDPERYAQAVMGWIRQQNFAYTLEPPRLSGQRIDQFLFQTRRGFCEHYSSAFTFLMRAAGVPARVVVGYQGGTTGRDKESLVIRQMDAHAWTEVWLAGRGWVRFDPTAAIAPERIERGMNQLTQDNSALFGEGAAAQLRYNQFKLLGQVREWADYADYLWQRDIVGFDQDKQSNKLFEWLGIRSMTAQLLTMFGLFATVVALIVGVIWWRRRKQWHPIDLPIVILSKRLAKQGLSRESHEGVLTWLERLATEPVYRSHAEQVAHVYQQLRYAEQVDDQLLSTLQQLVNRWPVGAKKSIKSA